MFDKLWQHLTQEKYILTVHWKDNGDMVRSPCERLYSLADMCVKVMWDNTAVLHRATSTGSYSEKYIRDMRRTTTKDSGKVPESSCR